MVPQHSTVVVSKRPDRFFSIQYVIRRVAYLTKQKRKKRQRRGAPMEAQYKIYAKINCLARIAN